MSGYCEIGRLTTANAPTSIVVMARTQANTGRWMKNTAMGQFPLSPESGIANDALRVDGRGDRCDRLSRGEKGHPVDDQPVALLQALAHDPRVLVAAVIVQGDLLRGAVLAHDIGGQMPRLVSRCRALGHEKRLHRADLDLAAQEHAGNDDVMGVVELEAHRNRAGRGRNRIGGRDQPAGTAIDVAVFQHQLGLEVVPSFQGAFVDAFLDRKNAGARLHHVDVDRV